MRKQFHIQVPRHSRRPLGCGVLLAGALALSLNWSCSGDAKDQEQPVPVQIVAVQTGALQQTVTADAVLFPINQSALVPKISAPVKKFYVNRGSHVRTGQLLAVLENRDLAAAAQDSKGTYDQAQAAYATANVLDIPQAVQKAQLDEQAAKKLLDAQQKIYDSRQQLFEQGALPRKDLDQAGVDLTNARNQYEIARKKLDAMNAGVTQQSYKSAKGQLESAQGKYDAAEAQLSYSEIRSPINGVVTERPLYPGEMATAGTPLMTIVDASQLTARAHVPQAEAAALKVGDPAEVSLPGVDTPFPGKVSVVSPALDPNSTTVEVWVQLKNPRGQLKPGSAVQLSMVVRSLPGALTVPSEALLTAPDGTTSVMVAGSDGRAHQRDVKAGIREGTRVQIVSGLQAGERIVASGAYGLPDNSKIAENSPGKPEANESKE
ncbi:MAG TPA: efflux RND transporter periplasmic adaptor subunit [Terriglobales bacterium]